MNHSLFLRGALALTTTVAVTLLAGCGGGSETPTAVGTAASAKLPASDSGISSKPITGGLTQDVDTSYTSVGLVNTPGGGMSSGMDPKPVTVYTTSFCGIANFDAAMLAAVNAARAVARSCGDTAMSAVGPVTNNAQLISAASRHSLDMAKVMKLEHAGSDGSSFSDRITAAGYAWGDAGENVAWNQRSIPDVIDSWLKSPGHCANIMNGARTEFGGACEKASDGSFYWTQLFAAPLQ